MQNKEKFIHDRTSFGIVLACILLSVLRYLIEDGPPILVLLSPLCWSLTGLLLYMTFHSSDKTRPEKKERTFTLIFGSLFLSAAGWILLSWIIAQQTGLDMAETIEFVLESCFSALISVKLIMASQISFPEKHLYRILYFIAGATCIGLYEGCIHQPKTTAWHKSQEQFQLRSRIPKLFHGQVLQVKDHPIAKEGQLCTMEIEFIDTKDALEWGVCCHPKLICQKEVIYEKFHIGDCLIDPSNPAQVVLLDQREKGPGPGISFDSESGRLSIWTRPPASFFIVDGVNQIKTPDPWQVDLTLKALRQ